MQINYKKHTICAVCSPVQSSWSPSLKLSHDIHVEPTMMHYTPRRTPDEVDKWWLGIPRVLHYQAVQICPLLHDVQLFSLESLTSFVRPVKQNMSDWCAPPDGVTPVDRVPTWPVDVVFVQVYLKEVLNVHSKLRMLSYIFSKSLDMKVWPEAEVSIPIPAIPYLAVQTQCQARFVLIRHDPHVASVKGQGRPL